MDRRNELYHLRELQIAQDPAAKEHILPQIASIDTKILDIGCGAGQTLIASNLTPEQSAIGVDIDAEALALARKLTTSIAFARARAESLPFPNESFHLVVSRVALPYTNIPQAAREIGRVLKRGGRCWLVLHPMSMTMHHFVSNLCRAEIKGAVFQLYVLLNGLCLHFFGRQFPFVFNPSRPFESSQTRRGMERVLRASGLAEVAVLRDRHFVVMARKI